jgi:SOS-response transcriptional repressor LexA
MQSAASRKSMRGRPKGEPTEVIRLPLPLATLARRLREGTLRAGDINRFLDLEPGAPQSVRFVEGTAACGFPSPVDDYLDRPLDFNELLIRNPAATFAVRLASDSMTGAGLFPGDIAVVDRSVTPTPGCIVLALLDGEFTIKRYRPREGGVVLQADNPAFPDIEVTAKRAFEVWGVVTKSIRMLSP